MNWWELIYQGRYVASIKKVYVDISQKGCAVYTCCRFLDGVDIFPRYWVFNFSKRSKIDIEIKLFRYKNYINWGGSIPPGLSPSGSASKKKCRKYVPPLSTQIILSNTIVHKKNQGSLMKRMILGLEQGI